MNNQLISVIMGAYNEREDWLRKAIESVLNQSYDNFEFIIILDNPTNELLEKVIKEYAVKDSRVKFIKNKVNLGLVKTLNKGIEVAEGDLIARMDADDICELNRFEKQVEFLKENKHVALVGANYSIINEEDDMIRRSNKIIADYQYIKLLLKARNFFCHPTFMFRKNIALKVGLYREVKYAEDYDFICRLTSNGYVITNMQQSLLKYRIRKNGITSANKKEQIKNSLLVIKYYNEQIKFGRDSFDNIKDNQIKCRTTDIIKFNVLNNLYRIAKRILLLFQNHS